MNPDTAARLEKVKRVSCSAKRVCFLLMVLVALIALAVTVGPLTAPETVTSDVGGTRYTCSELPRSAVAIAIVADLGGFALVLVGLHRLSRLFGNYSRGEIFTRDNAHEIRVIS